MAEKMVSKYEVFEYEVEHRVQNFEEMADVLQRLIEEKAETDVIRGQLNKIAEPVIDIAIMRELIEDADDHIANRMVELKKMFHKEITYN